MNDRTKESNLNQIKCKSVTNLPHLRMPLIKEKSDHLHKILNNLDAAMESMDYLDEIESNIEKENEDNEEYSHSPSPLNIIFISYRSSNSN